MNHLRIEDPADPRLAPYVNVRDKDARRQGTFVAEGIVVLESVLDGGRHPLESVLVSERRVDAVAPALARVPVDVPVYVVPHELLLDVVGFKIHRGLLAVGRRTPVPTLAALCAPLAPGAVVLVLEDLTDADNVGASFRNAAAFGAAAVVLTERCADPLYRKAIRVSAGHAVRLPFHRGGSAEEILTALHSYGFLTVAMCLDEDARPLHAWAPPTGRVAIWLGTEGGGLSEAARSGAREKIWIEMARGVDSLNVSVAGAVALYAVAAARAE